MKLKDIIERMIGYAQMERYLGVPRHYGQHRPIPEEAKPGALIKRLKPVERELLQTATAEDFKGMRLDAAIPHVIYSREK